MISTSMWNLQNKGRKRDKARNKLLTPEHTLWLPEGSEWGMRETGDGDEGVHWS